MKLLIIESPGKQATIKKYLGADWTVLASLGHIRGLAHNLDFLQKDFEPAYEWISEKANAMKQLKEAAKKAEDIYLAADKDMEGEQIAYSVCLLLKLNPKTAKRITFTEITQKAILHAIEHPGIIDMHRVHTQQCRAQLDLLIGFTMSPLLWNHVAPSLSAGRCQTPAIRLVVERENDIQSFKVSSGWKIRGEWVTAKAKANEAKGSKPFPGCMMDELEDETSVQNYLENIHSEKEAIVDRKIVKPYTESAPLPLITSTLQQQASALYHLNPKSTMKIAQRLYEAGYITYMRTDKAVLSDDAVKEAKEWVHLHYGEEYVRQEDPPQPKRQKGKNQQEEVKAQEAHEAIRPTHMEYTDLDEKEEKGNQWSSIDKKVYHLIWQRAVQSVMAPLRGETATLQFHILNDDDFSWESRTKHIVFEGWRRAGSVKQIDSDEEDEEKEEKEDSQWEQWKEIKEGDPLTWTQLHAEPVETKPKPRFTEATLVRELETYGIGRPSTFASLLSVIQEKGYVESRDIPPKEMEITIYDLLPEQWPPRSEKKKKKVGGEKAKLVPTNLGRSVLHFMLQHFNDLFEYGFTARMEKRLDAIAEGKESWKEVLRDMWNSYKDRYEVLRKGGAKKEEGDEKDSALNKDNSALMKDSHSKKRMEWGDLLVSVQTKKGPLLLIESDPVQFLGWPQGLSFQEMTREKALAFKEECQQKKASPILGEWEENQVIKKSGKFGEYVQCGEYSIPYQEGESIEKIIERLEEKKRTKQSEKAFEGYSIRTGPYGPYIVKTSLKTPQFVSLPKGIQIDTLTQKEVEYLYKTGLQSKLEAKKSWKKKNETK